MTEAVALQFVQTEMCVDTHVHVTCNQKVLRQKLRSFVPFFNREAPGRYLDSLSDEMDVPVC